MTQDKFDLTFWESLDQLVATSEIVIDRPKGSRHPRNPSVVYPLDYGYLDETVAIDGGGIDVWIGSQSDRRVVGILTSADLLKRDAEIKILLGCSEDEMTLASETSNNGLQASMLIRRGSPAQNSA